MSPLHLGAPGSPERDVCPVCPPVPPALLQPPCCPGTGIVPRLPGARRTSSPPRCGAALALPMTISLFIQRGIDPARSRTVSVPSRDRHPALLQLQPAQGTPSTEQKWGDSTAKRSYSLLQMGAIPDEQGAHSAIHNGTLNGTAMKKKHTSV